MKTTIILIALSFFLFISCSQNSGKKSNFEGIIEYHNSFICKTKNIDSIALRVIFGKSATLYFKDGNFSERYNDGVMLEQFYNKKENKTYIKKNLSDTLFWFNCAQKPEKIIKWKLIPHQTKVLKIDCDELVTYYKEKTIHFYFNSDSFPINPNWYNKYSYSNKNFVTKIMKSMYLKYKIEYPDFIAEVTATSISKQKVDPRTFEIPQTAILIKE
ncbi:MAG: hypothetical protein HYR91_03250 [Flavobacteriia bacterium]|nr:hypothetical protein [Flavobacteriia bacterium]